MSKHTPGEWKVYKGCILASPRNIKELLKAGKSVTTRRICVAEPSNYVDPKTNAANLQLIAAAPDLLEALKMLHADFDWNTSDWDVRLRAVVEAAIAKAEGVAE